MVAELKNYIHEQYYFRLRLGVAGLLVLSLFALLASRFYYLQIIQYNHYQTLAENNRISLVPTIPNRGLILDKNGVVLAHNFFVYTLEITPAKVKNLENTITELGQLIEVSTLDKKRFKKFREQSHSFESAPIRTHLNEIEAAKFAVNHYRFPGVEIKSRLFRHYPLGKLGSHMVGYIGRINDKDIENLKEDGVYSNYKGSDHIGKSGLEQFYEQQLHGVTGFQQVEIDADGHAVRVLSSNAPVPGDNLILSADSKLQEIAETAFGERRGAMVAINPKTGEVLTYVSQPTFNPNLFVDGIDTENWKLLNESLDKPLINRPLRGIYPPGSTFKPFVALAGLEAGKRNPPFAIQDPGFFMLPGSRHRYRDWKPSGHGIVDMQRAITISCDTFFYGLAMELGIERLTSFVRHFGFGRRSDIDIKGEIEGLLPTPEWKMRRYKQPWYPGETVIVGIGQGYTLTTPLQLAQATAILANNGVAMKPHLVTKIQNGLTGKQEFIPSVVQDRIELNPDNIEIVKRGMIDVTLPGGTAASVGANSGYSIAAKTGTAQVIGIKQNEKYNEHAINERHRDHALFIAFAPAEDPTIALAVIVENGGHGGSAAGPIARKVMDYYLLGKLPAVEPTIVAKPPPANATGTAITTEEEFHD
ncbi:MAG: penicillin-binding protein 2 [Methylotenera sp.]|uniref:penicillin-binding protein 2 n=1 Tax=Methylotenera sp. TaxID=2051956 RepID=UPI002722DA20|nr:penicillin-binding protein 2 [Methylotenera sp.]MDO9151850.1 penicillin-binding protein 2 [Methylotenera sp.]